MNPSKSRPFGMRSAKGSPRHRRFESYQVDEALNRTSRLGKMAWDWEAKDIDGTVHRLSEYRGKVVVMDFWYRGCGWCMRPCPRSNTFQRHFRDEPVVVLGMSIDEDEERMRGP